MKDILLFIGFTVTASAVSSVVLMALDAALGVEIRGPFWGRVIAFVARYCCGALIYATMLELG